METNRGPKQNRINKKDRLSELPDCVLIHIMGFMDTLYAVRTSVLSKRWKNLWKYPTTLSFYASNYEKLADHEKFVSWVLSCRDGSLPLFNLNYGIFKTFQTRFVLLSEVLEYAVSHNVQRVTVNVTFFNFRYKSNPFRLLLSCLSLSFLELNINCPGLILILPKSLQLPALKKLSLGCVWFSASDNDCAEPFSNLNSLDTLAINECFLHGDAKFLCISNLNLSSLKLHFIRQEYIVYQEYKVVFSTPNLSSLTIQDLSTLECHELSSTCNLSSLEDVNIDICACISYPIIIGWLQVFPNIKRLTLSPSFLRLILNDLSNLDRMRVQPLSFPRLESLKVDMNSYTKISKEEVDRATNYLLQNSPLSRVVIIDNARHV